jgi:hypothetical protein
MGIWNGIYKEFGYQMSGGGMIFLKGKSKGLESPVFSFDFNYKNNNEYSGIVCNMIYRTNEQQMNEQMLNEIPGIMPL